MSTIVITGGSRGIGAAAVELFAAQGHRVYFLYEKNMKRPVLWRKRPVPLPSAAMWPMARR